MKKILFAFCLVVLGLAAKANSVTVQNFLTNPITLTFICVNPDGTIHHSNPISLPAGPTVFANPTLMPGLAGSATADARVTMAYGFCNPYDLAISSPNITPAQSSQSVPAGNDCNGGAFNMYWNEGINAPYNAIILIL